jgi:site-specific recombinase XerD
MSRTTPIPSSIQTINGYPKKLVIYLTSASQFYWTRVYYQNKYYTQSTKTNDVKKAKQFAIKFYERTLVHAVVSKDPTVTNKSLAVVGRAYLDSVENTQLKQTYRNDLSRFNHALVPFFGEQDIQTITNAQISRLLAKLKKDGSSSATQTHYLVVLRKILKFAIANDLIDKLPVFPKVHGKLQTSQKRDYLTDEEYESLIRMSEVCTSEETIVRGVTITLEMKFLIQFMVNSFIRPSDLRVLKHKHVNIKKVGKDEWIVLSHPATKTTANEVQAMPATVGIYKQLCALRLKTQKKISPDEFVFFPQYKIRDTAMSVIGRLFREILERTGITEQTDKNVTLYSLRHTSIMMRLVKGNVNTLHLARNARTSQQMIDQFYASHLTTDQVREHLHRFESVEKKKVATKKTAKPKKTSSKSVQ